MNKILVFIICCFLHNTLRGQEKSIRISSDSIITPFKHTTTLFEYGEPLSTGEVNFTNLFRNFSIFVKNANQSIKLISYKYVTQVDNKKQIRKYLKMNSKVFSTNGHVTMAMDSMRIEESFIRLDVPFNNAENEKISPVNVPAEIEKLTGKIHVNDEVYVLNFMAGQTSYEFYMFVNPSTKSVLTEGNFLGFKIPIYYADFYSKRLAPIK